MKKFASSVLLPITLATPLLASAWPVLDLKAAIKAGMGKTPASAPPASGYGAPGMANAPGRTVDSTVVTPVLAGIKSLDIAGVHLGMSGEEARQVLKKLNPGLRYEPVNEFNIISGFKMTNDTMRMTPYPNGMDTFTVYLNEAGNVYFVRRELTKLPPERMIVMSTFMQSLAEKFDAPGVDTRNRGNNPALYRWSYDMQGRQYIQGPGSGQDDPCRDTSYAGNQFGFQERPLPSCAATIASLMFNSSKNRELVDGYHLTLTAPWLRHDAPTVRANADAASRQREAEQNKVKDNKPQL